ncbi:MAG: LTA synthase family protein [Pirellulaceae bacterium]
MQNVLVSGSAESGSSRQASPDWPTRIMSGGLILCAFLLPVRVYTFGWQSEALETHAVRRIAGMFIYDAMWLTAFTAAFLLASILLGRCRRAGMWLYAGFLVASEFMLLAGLANTEVVRQLGRPLSYEWLYYSDFFLSPDARDIVLAAFTWKLAVAFGCLSALFVLLAIVGGKVGQVLVQRMARSGRVVALGMGVLWFSYLLVGSQYVQRGDWAYERMANPVWVLARSLVIASRSPKLLTIPTPYDDEEFRPPSAPPTPTPFSGNPPRNVVVWVFESLPAEYVGAYGSKYPVTPELDRWTSHAAVFSNIYAHSPSTNKSLFSLLCSTYPWVSYRSVTQEKPEIALPSITSQLKQQGFATAIFYSGDLEYQNAIEFVKQRGFDFVQDYRTRPTKRPLFTHSRWTFLNGTDERSTADSLVEWIDTRRDKPFFAMLWTTQTHYPYFAYGKEESLGPAANFFNRYLNALKYGDRAFGEMMRWLDERSLLDDTLVVVMGDHGEAFGRHGQLSHGHMIYEENCHVPLILINRRLFRGETYETVGGLIDVAPTIAHILNLPPAVNWQGRSLFAPDRPDRTYFFAPWSDSLYGMRQGNRKLIYNASQNRFEVYDLANDPEETTNLAAQWQEFVDEGQNRLASWLQYQNRLFDKLMKQSREPSPLHILMTSP